MPKPSSLGLFRPVYLRGACPTIKEALDNLPKLVFSPRKLLILRAEYSFIEGQQRGHYRALRRLPRPGAVRAARAAAVPLANGATTATVAAGGAMAFRTAARENALWRACDGPRSAGYIGSPALAGLAAARGPAVASAGSARGFRGRPPIVPRELRRFRSRMARRPPRWPRAAPQSPPGSTREPRPTRPVRGSLR